MPNEDKLGTTDSTSAEIEATSTSSSVNESLLGQQKFKLQFSNVSYITKQNKKLVKILNDVCGEFKSGRLTAVLGPSGAGKTSILNVLSGFKASNVSGQFTFNGSERNVLTFRKSSCYIPQDFALLDLLTVQETMNDSADLKLPAQTISAEKRKIVDDILQILNMDKCRHRLVRNLSGGERKRLSIAIELVTNPPVMFFDEPTSGLDSVASLQVINYLRRLALDGHIIVCVIHQPSSRLIKLFDDVLVMSRGQVLYSGPEREMIATFEAAGFAFPNYYNPADFALEVSSEEHNKPILGLIERNKKRHCGVDKQPNEDANLCVQEKSKMSSNLNSHTTIEMRSNNEAQVERMLYEPCRLTSVRLRSKVNVWRQLVILTRRSLRTMSRNLIAVQLRVFMHVLVAALVGAVFWDIGNDGARTLTNISCIFFIIMFIFFGNSMPSILLCPQETAVFIREYLNGWYSLRAYYASKLLSDLPMLFICPTLFTTIIYFMTSQPDDMARFAMCWGISLILAIIGHFMGLAFGSTFDVQMAILLVPGVAIPFMIFSGFFIRIHELSSVFRPLCDISFYRYTMEALMQAIYGYNRPDLECHREFCYFKSPTKLLKELGMLGDLYGHDIFILLLWIIFFKVLFFFSLVLRIKRAQ
ncbi:ATP-binding cassette sub-family G member 1 [Anastrepha obliqua]|uniref:ATP-binding cassette sub-family G member 1 n=1 Tax=Anastrepha obliqua TaxID=95512 RepID=UPI002409DDAB|nr:ATP-binding cassette sub-family G member 1 [Anastrepha obliqua]XP_054741599.1 ATP-binding cassette sub-family G member 1 [Anastrepha obliqua]XP_054741600.1 ATP-binding cassette sub-family G member 1 [Anastrepha obliqua]XP_054741601.1 ATP-binding cassette sub-family G member 1 [Anastrepha obliqua]XP_054741602.1 ATP-binding cassette sub-family G member 1 [Anastrepha obliqua]XP_054741603.1 ATP-binding cassette sub-family G member 1 [Anastrepha obliqua]XP_054741604.1 ATP-binding cassette sub-f